MKKYFITYTIDDYPLFMAMWFILFTPIWILFMIHNGFSWVIISLAVISLIYIIQSYKAFNPEDYKSKKEIDKQIQALTFKEKQKMLTQFKNKKEHIKKRLRVSR